MHINIYNVLHLEIDARASLIDYFNMFEQLLGSSNMAPCFFLKSGEFIRIIFDLRPYTHHTVLRCNIVCMQTKIHIKHYQTIHTN